MVKISGGSIGAQEGEGLRQILGQRKANSAEAYGPRFVEFLSTENQL